MKGSFLLKQADAQFEYFINQIKRKTKGSNATGSVFGVNLGSTEQNLQRQVGRRPAARDGHTGAVWNNFFVVFGGDRHHMPFNDLFMLDLEAEFKKQESAIKNV